MGLFLLTFGIIYVAWADHEEHKKLRWYEKIFTWEDDNGHDNDHNRKRERKRDEKKGRNNSRHYGERYLTPVNNPIYIQECGDCHFAYQPELLPSGSWEKIITGFDDHFGEEIEMDTDSKKLISDYLQSNAAEKSPAKRAAKIMKCLGKRTPLRISQIPYILQKHNEIKPEVYKRESVGSLSNCPACHKTAEEGIYDDDHAVIPP